MPSPAPQPEHDDDADPVSALDLWVRAFGLTTGQALCVAAAVVIAILAAVHWRAIADFLAVYILPPLDY